MARSVDEINLDSFQDTGLQTPIARFTFSLHVRWTDNNGVEREHGPQTYTYPNDLASMPLAVRREFAIRMVTAAVRVQLDIDDWSDHT